MTASTPTYNAGKAWLVTIISILASISMAMVVFKAMTTAPFMMAYFNIDIAVYGNVSSIIGAFAIIGSIPSGALLAKLGPRVLIILCLAAGAISGYAQIFAGYAGLDFVTWMAIGALGSFFYGMWTVNGPLLTSAWFPPEKRGLPNSISTAWVSVAQVILLVCSAPVIALGGDAPNAFLNIWWMMCILQTVFLVLAILFIRMPKPENSFIVVNADEGAAKGKISDGFKNPGAWMLIVIFLGYGFVTAAYGNYFPTYLQTPVEGGGLAMESADANMLSSIAAYVMIIMNFVYGFVLNKIPNKRYGILVTVIAILTAFVGIVMFLMPSISVVAPYLVIYGIVSQLYPPVCFTVLPELTDSQEELSACIGVVAIFSNLSGVLATAVIANATAMGGWSAGSIPLTVLGVLGIICSFPLIKMYAKGYAKHHPEELAA